MAHWYVVGANPDRLEEIRQAGHLVDVFDGPVSAEDQTALWRQLSAASPDGLWITWSSLEPPEMTGLRRLRVAQPGLQIVVEVSSELTPPNPDLAQLVGLGIYAIVPETADFADATTRHYTYADAAPWQGGPVSWDQATEPAVKTVKAIEWRTVEVEKKIAVSARPVLIAVVGAAPGTGTTTTAVSAASLLASMGHEVALVESASAPPALARWDSELSKGITPFASPAPDPVELIRRRQWPYIIVDAGAIPAWSDIAPWQADLTILVGPGDSCRFGRWEPLAAAVPDGAIVAGAVVGGKDGGKVVEALGREAGLTAFVVPESDHKRSDRALRELLAPVLADIKPRRRWWTQPARPTPAPDRTEPEPKVESEWKYMPSPAYVPAYAPPAPVPVQVSVARPPVSPVRRLWRLFRDVLGLWIIASLVAWFIVLWNANVPGGDIGGHFAVWAQWIIHVDSSLIHRL